MVARQVRRSVVMSNLRVGLLAMDSDRLPLRKRKDVLHGAVRAVPLRQSVEQPWGCIGSGSLPERARGEVRDSKGKSLPRLSGRGFVVAITQHFRRRAHDSAACLRDRYRLLRDASSSSRSGAMRAGAGGLGPASIFFDVNWSTSYGPVLRGLCCADGACGPVQKD